MSGTRMTFDHRLDSSGCGAVSDLVEKTHGSTQYTVTVVWVTVTAVGYCGLGVWVTGEGGVAVFTALFATVTVGYGLL